MYYYIEVLQKFICCLMEEIFSLASYLIMDFTYGFLYLIILTLFFFCL